MLQTQTQTQTQIQTQTQTQTQTVELLVLNIRENKEVINKKKVTWHESVIDNEHMNKRKSKKCCIFHKNQECYSSSEEDTSDSDDY